MKRVWIRRVTWAVAIVAVLLTVVAAGIALSLDGLVRRMIRVSLERQTGAGVRLDAATFGLRDGSFRLSTLVLSNPPGFSPGPLLSVPELYLRYDAGAANSNIFRLAEARLHLGEVNLVIDRQGRTNLMALSGPRGGAAGNLPPGLTTNLLRGMQFGGVELLTLTLGRITLRDERDESRSMVLDLGITNRTLTNVTSVVQLLPLALEIALRGGLQDGLIPPRLGTNSLRLR